MRVLVCGSRDWPDDQALWDYLSERHGEHPIREVIHGAAFGADSCAGLWAERMHIPERVFPADWERHGKGAGFRRNLQMLDEKPDLVIAFQHNGSRGTQHTIDNARKRGIPVEVVTFLPGGEE